MLTIRQLNQLAEILLFISISGFVVYLIHMVLSHFLRIKGYLADEKKAERIALIRRTCMRIGFALVCFFMMFVFMNMLRNWGRPDYALHHLSPELMERLRRSARGEVINSLQLMGIFIFVSVVIRTLLHFREEFIMLKSRKKEKEDDRSN